MTVQLERPAVAESQQTLPHSDEQMPIDLAILVKLLRENILVVVATTVLALVAAILYLNLATYRYTAELRITPVQGDSSSMTSRLSGLASLANINLPTDMGTSQFSLYTEGLFTAEVAQLLSQNRPLMGHIFPKNWDEASKDWREPRGGFTDFKRSVKKFLGMPELPWRRPDGFELARFIGENVFVDHDPQKAITSIQFSHEDPNVAQMFLDQLTRITDETLRRRILDRTEGNIRYLSAKLETTQQAEHRLALTQALSEQEKMRMMASSGLPFAAERFGNVTVSPTPTSPRPLMVLLAAPFFGALLGIGAIVGWHLVQLALGRRA